MRMKPPSGPKKQTQTNPVLSAVEWANFKPNDGFSPQVRLGTPYGGVPRTAYYKRDCHGLRKTLAL